MSAKVAVDGEVKATAASSVAKGADSGAWSAGTVSYTSYSKLESGGKKVIWKAECLFSFDGKAGNSPFKTTEQVALTATPKKLSKSSNSVLVHGDSNTGTEGNKLEVSASNKLTAS